MIDWDENVYAEASKQMILRGDYLNIYINDAPFNEKPPFFLWLQVLSFKLFGINEFAARFPAAVLGFFSVLLCILVGRQLYSLRLGMLWGLIYITSLLPAIFGLFSTAKINIVIAFFIIIYSLITLFKWQISANKKNLFVGGLFSGFSGTIAAIGGPPVAIVLQNIPKQKFIGTITCYFVLGNIISLIALWTIDKINLNHFLFAVLCAPSCGLGFWIAPYFSAKLSAKKFKLIIQIICILGVMR